MAPSAPALRSPIHSPWRQLQAAAPVQPQRSHVSVLAVVPHARNGSTQSHSRRRFHSSHRGRRRRFCLRRPFQPAPSRSSCPMLPASRVEQHPRRGPSRRRPQRRLPARPPPLLAPPQRVHPSLHISVRRAYSHAPPKARCYGRPPYRSQLHSLRATLRSPPRRVLTAPSTSSPPPDAARARRYCRAILASPRSPPARATDSLPSAVRVRSSSSLACRNRPNAG